MMKHTEETIRDFLKWLFRPDHDEIGGGMMICFEDGMPLWDSGDLDKDIKDIITAYKEDQ